MRTNPLNVFAASDIADTAIATLRSETGKAFPSGVGGIGCTCAYCKLVTFLLELDESENGTSDHDPTDREWQNDSCTCMDGTCAVCQATYDELTDVHIDELFRALFHDERLCPLC
jgi:hypothetical protein